MFDIFDMFHMLCYGFPCFAVFDEKWQKRGKQMEKHVKNRSKNVRKMKNTKRKKNRKFNKETVKTYFSKKNHFFKKKWKKKLKK